MPSSFNGATCAFADGEFKYYPQYGRYQGQYENFSFSDNTIYYIKTDNAVCFGFSQNQICMACVKGKDVISGEDRYIYLFQGFSYAGSEYWTYIFAEKNSDCKKINAGYNQSVNAVSMSQICLETDNEVITSDYLYLAVQCRPAANNIAFSLDGKEYLILKYVESEAFPRPIIKLT